MNKVEVISEEQKAMARFAKAMGHPIRLYVLDLLSKQSCCYSGDLKEAGLIQGEIEAPKIKYCLNQENWKVAQQLFKSFMES